MEESKILAKLKENYDYKVLSIDFLRDSGGRTYIVSGEGQKFFLKIAGKAFQNTIRQSVDIVRYLSRKGFPVPDIIETKSGMPMLETHDEGQEYLLVYMNTLMGKNPISVHAERK